MLKPILKKLPPPFLLITRLPSLIKLHRDNCEHCGIIVCTNDPDRSRLATRIDAAIAQEETLLGKLIRVVRPAS
jgi:hypothetical protein